MNNNICLFHDTPMKHKRNPLCIKNHITIKEGNTRYYKGYTICYCGGRFSGIKAYKHFESKKHKKWREERLKYFNLF